MDVEEKSETKINTVEVEPELDVVVVVLVPISFAFLVEILLTKLDEDKPFTLFNPSPFGSFESHKIPRTSRSGAYLCRA